jgi:hypothetical protein
MIILNAGLKVSPEAFEIIKWLLLILIIGLPIRIWLYRKKQAKPKPFSKAVIHLDIDDVLSNYGGYGPPVDLTKEIISDKFPPITDKIDIMFRDADINRWYKETKYSLEKNKNTVTNVENRIRYIVNNRLQCYADLWEVEGMRRALVEFEN